MGRMAIYRKLNAYERMINHGAEKYVYFARCGEFMKIGHSSSPKRRLSEFSGSSPHDVTLILVLPTHSPGRLEKALHARFAADRHRLEWFRLSDQLLDFVERYSKYNVSDTKRDDTRGRKSAQEPAQNFEANETLIDI